MTTIKRIPMDRRLLAIVAALTRDLVRDARSANPELDISTLAPELFGHLLAEALEATTPPPILSDVSDRALMAHLQKDTSGFYKK